MSDCKAILKGSGNMEADWDARARENARMYIECSRWSTEEQFDASGRSDLSSFFRNITIEHDAIVLEIGCGIGRLLKPLAEKQREVHGVDVSGEMVARGRKRLRRFRNVHLHKNLGSDLDRLPDRYFDLVFSFVTFQHIPQKTHIYRYFEEARRVLKPAGLFRFQVDGRAHDIARLDNAGTWDGVVFEETEILQSLRSRGFEILELAGQNTLYFTVTARRPGDTNKVVTELVRYSPFEWEPDSLHGVAERIGIGDTDELIGRIMGGTVPVSALGDAFVHQNLDLEPEHYVDRVYRAFLNRPPDERGREHYVGALQGGSLTREGLVETVMFSSEFHNLIRHQSRTPQSLPEDP